MAVYAVGDIQGCYKPLRKLLDKVKFNPKKDVLWCAGDLVNRGPDSLKTLRFLKSLGESCVCVLGNHDIQLLAYYAGGKSFSGDSLDEVIQAEDAQELVDWLRHQPLLHHDEALGWSMVHAGLNPMWSLNKAKKRARKVELMLQSEHWQTFCKQLQLKGFPQQEPKDKSDEAQYECLFFATAVFTRTRFCNAEGEFDWRLKKEASNKSDMKPWFEHKKALWSNDTRIVYGHWASKGLVLNQPYVLGLDSGCLWGGSLTVAKLSKKDEIQTVSLPCEACMAMDTSKS